MELFHLLSGYIMPWWEMARLHPEKRFPLTFKRIDEMEDDEKAEMKREQVRFGIQAGYDEICKLYQRLLMAPMIYLAVLDPKVGPSVLRAILAIVVEEGVDINAAQTEFDDEDYGVEVTEDLDWGVFQYDDPEDRPEEEKIWYEWLKESGDGPKLAHWFQQLLGGVELSYSTS